jgi:ABC-type multidrug transport system ATPase subunit
MLDIAFHATQSSGDWWRLSGFTRRDARPVGSHHDVPGPGPAPAIVLDAVTRTFGPVRAIDNLSLQVNPGEVLGLLGHNGAGKTTAIRLIAGLLAPTSGRVLVHDLDPYSQGPTVRRQLGVLPANAAVDDRLTGWQNLKFAAELYDLPREGLDARIAELLQRFDLGSRGRELAGGYSTGMRQRLSLARVLLHDPAVLLLDEPTASLDPVAARQVRGLIADLGADETRTVLLCTHDLAEAERLCDRVAILEHGSLKALGSPGDLASDTTKSDLVIEVHPDETDIAAGLQTSQGAAGNVVEPGRVRWPRAARSDVPALVHALARADVRVFSVTRREPSLEDVYLTLHNEARTGEDVSA